MRKPSMKYRLHSIPKKFSAHSAGFTLIELSIVLVIIGLIIGGVLVGQDLIAAATVRSQVAQIEKYNAAVNTFHGKYGYLPGDMVSNTASAFGFYGRSGSPGEGDGNGILQAGAPGWDPTNMRGVMEGDGELAFFWDDLSSAGFVEDKFAYNGVPSIPMSQINSYWPAAKIGNGNIIYVWSGGWQGYAGTADGMNYFGLAALISGPGGVVMTGLGGNQDYCSGLTAGESPGGFSAQPGLTVSQAYNIDKKMDDGFPQSGNVVALYICGNAYDNYQMAFWAEGYGNSALANTAPSTNLPSPASTTCLDNGGNSSNTTAVYSMNSAASNVNCALSFRFQ